MIIGLSFLQKKFGSVLADVLPVRSVRTMMPKLVEKYPQAAYESVSKLMKRGADLSAFSFDLPVNGEINFEHLANLFFSSPYNQSIITFTIKQAAYLFGLIREMHAKKIIEIGRYKGGATFLMAAAMRDGELWSVYKVQ